ncbi:MAG: metallophosphoesterase [Planctomycetes bacterium]|nr:metallophosphoesterase [Planctomycetota bacterium]
MKPLDLVILGDMHYVGPLALEATPPQRRRTHGLELAVCAVRDALRTGRPDAIVLLGDIVDRGSTPGALAALQEVHDTLRQFDIPLIAVPGNHDDDPNTVQEIFQCQVGVHEVGDYLLVLFSDDYAETNEQPQRSEISMNTLEIAARTGKAVIVVQHAVVLPDIQSDYPYNILGNREIAAAYSRAEVCLSISGHYHAGCEPLESGGVTYLVCPILCDAPCHYTRVRMEGRCLRSVERHPVSLAEAPGEAPAASHPGCPEAK